MDSIFQRPNLARARAALAGSLVPRKNEIMPLLPTTLSRLILPWKPFPSYLEFALVSLVLAAVLLAWQVEDTGSRGIKPVDNRASLPTDRDRIRGADAIVNGDMIQCPCQIAHYLTPF